jgi:ribosomal protein S18 acetylase RimI-like enzyme
MEVRIRQAGVDDSPAVAALQLRTALFAYASIFPAQAPRPTLDQLTLDWERRLTGRRAADARGYLAILRDQIAGVIMAGAAPDQLKIGHITRLYVDVPHWGQGIGTLLYEEAISHLRHLGCCEASLWVIEDNARARTWYERLGWICTGELQVATQTLDVNEVRYTRPL